MPHDARLTGWTIETLAAHHAALRDADARLADERDRRYADVIRERDKALVIATQIQAYKDERANQLREQISSERGSYLGRDEYRREYTALLERFEAAIKPLSDYVAGQHGPRNLTTGSVAAILAAVAIFGGLYFGFHNDQPTGGTDVVCTATYHPAPCP